MKDHMVHLSKAVKFSIEIQNLKEELEDIPVKVREVESQLQSLQGDHDQKKDEWNKTESEKRQLESELAQESERLKSKEERLNTIKTQKEYQAVVREISLAKTANREREERLKKLNQVLDELKPSLEPLSVKLKEILEQLTKEKSHIQGDLDQIQTKIRDMETQMNEQLGALPDDIRHKFKQIEAKRQPPAALVIDGTCQECFMNVPPQLYIEIQKNQEVHSCPNCHRLLYLETA